MSALRGRQRILREGAWVAVGQAATAVGLVVGIRVLTEYVPPAVFGNLSLLLGVFVLSRSVFSVSLGSAAFRYYGEVAPGGGMGRLRATTSHLLIRSMAFPVLGILLWGVVSAITGASSVLPYVLLAALLAADTARTYEWNFLVASRRQREASILDILDAVGRPGLAVAAILLFAATVDSVLAAYALSAMLAFVAARFFFDRGTTGVSSHVDPDLRKHLLAYALPLMPMAAVTWISAQSDRYILAPIIAREQIGVYAAAYGLMSQPFLMAQMLLERTLVPPYFLAVSAGDREKERRTFRVFVLGTMAVCGAGVVFVFLFSNRIAGLFLAEKYRASAALMPPLALGNALLAMQYVFAKPLYAHKRTREMLWIYTFGAVASVAVTVPLVFALGVMGAAIACPIYYSLQILVTVLRTREKRVHAGSIDTTRV